MARTVERKTAVSDRKVTKGEHKVNKGKEPEIKPVKGKPGKPKEKTPVETKPKSKPKAVEPKSNIEYGLDRRSDLPWCEKKVKLFKCLKKLGAVSKDTAKANKEIVNMSNERLSARDVRHYSYHARAGGLIDVVEGEKGYLFYLTKKGQRVDPDAEYKSVQAKKAA